jgi:VanZ family protein
MSRRARFFTLWTLLIVAVVLPWTTFQNHTHWQRVGWIPFMSPPIRIRDVVLNVLLYVPWGYLGVRRRHGAWREVITIVGFAAALSLATEATQLYSHGRFPSATDFTCNIAGALIGATWARMRAHGGTMGHFSRDA